MAQVHQKSKVVKGSSGHWEIEFFAGPDCKPFAGRHLTGGVPTKVNNNLVVKFRTENINGKWIVPIIKVEGRAELVDLVAVYDQMIAEDNRASQWMPDGYAELADAVAEYEAMLTEWNKIGRQTSAPKPIPTKAKALIDRYPHAALFHQAVLQEQRAKPPDPAGLIPAAKNCKRILRETGDIESAKAALAERREGFVD